MLSGYTFLSNSCSNCLHLKICLIRKYFVNQKSALHPPFCLSAVTTTGKLKNTLSSHLALKGHGNEANFLGFLQKLVPHRSLTLPFEPLRFWLRIRGDIRKTTPRVGESAFECLKENSASQRVVDSPTRRVGESLTPQLGESSTPWLGELGSRHSESGSRYSNFLKFSIDFPNFKRLNQPFKR